MVLSSEKNLYEILEISYSASTTTIKSAYRKLVRKYHPDLNSGDEACAAKFKEVTEAYEILCDPVKKKDYDLLKGFHKEQSKAKFNEANKAYKQTQTSERENQTRAEPNFSNIFNDILDGFKNTTSSKQNSTFKTKQAVPQHGSNVQADVTITMHEAMNGTTRTINILHNEVCPNCDGRTFLNGAQCPLCKGLGEQSIHKKLNVKIPAGVKHGSKIRIANEGDRGYNGGKNGDLYLQIKIESNSFFEYNGLNVLCTIPITPDEAALGAQIEVPTPEGKVSMKILPNTHSGQKFRLAGQGLKEDGKFGKKGDMIVTVNIEIPKKLSEEEIKLYKQLKNATKTNIRENLLNDK